MPTLERCLQLIYQADGSIEEKYECASMTYWGNLVPVTSSYVPAPVYNDAGYVVYPPETADQLSGGIDSVNCPSCGCGGGGGSSPAPVPMPFSSEQSSSGIGGYVNMPGLGSIGASASMLVLAAIIGVMIARKG